MDFNFLNQSFMTIDGALGYANRDYWMANLMHNMESQQITAQMLASSRATAAIEKNQDVMFNAKYMKLATANPQIPSTFNSPISGGSQSARTSHKKFAVATISKRK